MSEPINPRQEEIKHKNFNKSNLFNKQLISSEAIDEILISILNMVKSLCKIQVRIIEVIGLSISSHNVNASLIFFVFIKLNIPSTKLGTSREILFK